jgi:hypothetical protein
MGAPVLWLCTGATPAESSLCQPGPEVGQQIESASKGLASPTLNVEEVIEPLRDLRRRLPKDLFVHARYQDAIKERGVEGHLREMLDEYLALKNTHAEDPFYLYLYGRALEGRSTPQAISAMEEVLKVDPSFAPAHQSLAEIYGNARFRDPKREKNERTQFFAACPSGAIPTRPGPLPPPGDLSQAEKLVAQRNLNTDVPELVYQAMQQDAWRLQRIRPFDWYTVEEKKQVAREGQLRQWSAWSLLVRHYRNTEQQEKASSLLEEMRGRLDRLQSERDPDLFWAAGTTLTALYLEGNQLDSARETLKRMEAVLVKQPDRKRSAELARLKAKLKRRS